MGNLSFIAHWAGSYKLNLKSYQPIFITDSNAVLDTAILPVNSLIRIMLVAYMYKVKLHSTTFISITQRGEAIMKSKIKEIANFTFPNQEKFLKL